MFIDSGLQVRRRSMARSSRVVVAMTLWEGYIVQQRPRYDPYTPYSPHLSYWTEPDPLCILLRMAMYTTKDSTYLLSYIGDVNNNRPLMLS